MANGDRGNGANGQETSKEMAREFKWFEISSVLINGALALVGIGAICIYQGQLVEMRKSTNAATSAAKTAADTLTEIQKGGADTHTLAEAAKVQAAASKQAAENSAIAIQKSGEEFRDDHRAWMQVNLKWPPSILNVGNSPAFEVTHFANLQSTNGGEVPDVANWWKTIKADTKVNRIPVAFPRERFGLWDDKVAEQYPNGFPTVTEHKEVVYLVGEISYRTFGKKHTTRFCGIWTPEAKAFNPGRGCSTWSRAD